MGEEAVCFLARSLKPSTTTKNFLKRRFNMKNRTVKHLLYAHPYDTGGLPIKQPFPTAKIEKIDPFLLLHHADVKVAKWIKWGCWQKNR
jgi:hypothetical protein